MSTCFRPPAGGGCGKAQPCDLRDCLRRAGRRARRGCARRRRPPVSLPRYVPLCIRLCRGELRSPASLGIFPAFRGRFVVCCLSTPLQEHACNALVQLWTLRCSQERCLRRQGCRYAPQPPTVIEVNTKCRDRRLSTCCEEETCTISEVSHRAAGCYAWMFGLDVVTMEQVADRILYGDEDDDDLIRAIGR